MSINTLPPLPLKNGCLEIDNSFLEHFTTCPRRCEYNDLLKRIPAGDKPALNFGSGIHRALEYRYKTYKNSPPDFDAEQSIYDNALLPYFTANPQPDEDHRTLPFAHEIIQQYNARFAHEPFSLLTDDKGEVLSEVSFAAPFGKIAGVDVIYTGRIDLPIYWDGQLGICDFKTAGMLGNIKIDEMKISPQFEGYAWSFSKLAGKPVQFFLVRLIRTKAKPGKPVGGWDTWWSEAFASHKEYFRPGQLDEWYQNTSAIIEEFLWYHAKGFMPQKKKACVMYGKCAYYDVCYNDPSGRGQELSSERFMANEWSPLK